MTKAETMHCAAILAAGIMTNEHKRMLYSPEDAVNLMEEIAKEIFKRQFEEQCKNEEWI